MPAYRLLLPLLAGCNWIYGLDSTKPLEIGVDAPPDLSDEDLDGTANEFDNCPGITNTDQRDRDNDGVGDACDLAPDRAGDRIVARYMFNRPTFDPTEWDSSGWNFQDGYVEQPSLGGIATMFTKLVPDGTYVVIEARMRIRFDREKQTNSTHVIVDGVGGDACLLTQSTVSSGLYLFTAAGATAISALDPGDDIPFTLVMLAVRQPTMSQPEPIDVCRVGSNIGSLPSRVRPPDTVGLKTIGNAVRVDYLVVYAGDSLD